MFSVVIVLLCLNRPWPVCAATIEAWVVHGSIRVQPKDEPGPNRTAVIAAARNEYEPFQLVLRASGGNITGVKASVSDLISANGAGLGRSDITLYREHYVYVRRPSPRSDAEPGLYPDALIPFVNPLDGSDIPPRDHERDGKGAKYDGSPFDLWRGVNQPIWVDVYVPVDTRPGAYKGAVRVEARGVGLLEIPVELTVWDFTLPATPTVRSHFGEFGKVAAAHGIKANTEQFRQVELRYCQALADHRITPPIPRHLYPIVGSDGTIDPTSTHQALKDYITRLRVNAFQIHSPPFRDPTGADRDKALRFLRSTYRYLEENGWHQGAYIYILDEPNDKEAYERVRQLAALVHEADRRIHVLCTEQTKTSDPSWGVLDQAVDIWVPLWPLHDESTGQVRLAAGNQLWSYTALCQGKQPSPWWQIDFPVLNYRVPLWINWHYRMTGLLYWTTVCWQDCSDPWLDQPSFRGAYNGEGMLFYPGTQAGFDGHVSSIRLKNTREGMEDYEYLRLLADRSGQAAADQYVAKVARSWFDWESDTDRLLEVRRQIAQALTQAK
jgi:hypothetical protein